MRVNKWDNRILNYKQHIVIIFLKMEPLKEERTEKVIVKKPDSAMMDIVVRMWLFRKG